MFSSIVQVIEDFKQGRFVIMVDDENRENEGDLMLAADFVSAEKINFMVQNARGLICLALTPEQVDRLKLPMMRSEFHQCGKTETAFTFSIEASFGITTGISAKDRAHTLLVASRAEAKPSDVICPGHIFPLKAHPHGVLGRQGHTEAGVELSRLSELTPATVLCEIINDDGSMSRLPDLVAFSKKHNIKIGKVLDLVEYVKSM